MSLLQLCLCDVVLYVLYVLTLRFTIAACLWIAYTGIITAQVCLVCLRLPGISGRIRKMSRRYGFTSKCFSGLLHMEVVPLRICRGNTHIVSSAFEQARVPDKFAKRVLSSDFKVVRPG